MHRQAIYITQPAYLSLYKGRLSIRFSETGEIVERPIMDLGFLILDHFQITYTHGILIALAKENVMVILCNEKHLPLGIYTALYHHHTPYGGLSDQLNMPIPLKKNLWQAIIKMKLLNQSDLLQKRELDQEKKIKAMIPKVLSGDSTGREACAAKYYWSRLIGNGFKREREGGMPNPLLNFGYTILRGVVARALIGSGLFPLISLYHRNRHNAHPLADDIMEPYRPFVDDLVIKLIKKNSNENTKQNRSELLSVLIRSCFFKKKQYKIVTAVEKTTASLTKSIRNNNPKLLEYPTFFIE